jgi:Ca-activated chloride channel family protein
MRFLWPELLWLLLLVPLLVAGYVALLARRRRSAIRFASLVLVRDAIGKGQRWRRHLPPALFLLGLILALLAVARPSATVTLPAEYMTVALAMDVSLSMRATDVEPNRLSAAQTAARAFIEELPGNVRLGIVSFAGTAAVVQSPTESRADMLAAIDRFQLQRGTATGSGLLLTLGMLFPDAGIDLESLNLAAQAGRAGPGAPIDRPRTEEAAKKAFTPVAPGSYKAGVIILLSDGRRTTGPDPIEIARMVADRGVRVYTVGFGTREGAPISVDGYSFFVRLDEETLKAMASITGGEYFHAGTAADLKKVYESLSLKLALERRETEISALFSAAAALLLLLAAWLSVVWFHRPAAGLSKAAAAER